MHVEGMTMSMKGISPLIAAVLLIGFTMAIAGLMATWATQFSEGSLETAGSEASCIGALDLSSLSFNDGTVLVKISNKHSKLNLTGLTASLEYSNPVKSKLHENILLEDYNVSDPLTPARSSWFIYDTGDNSTAPVKITVVASNCPKYPQEETF